MEHHLILERKDRTKLAERHDQFVKGEVHAFVTVVVMTDGTTQVDFDLADVTDLNVFNKIGGGLLSAIDHLRNLALEKRFQKDVLAGLRAN